MNINFVELSSELDEIFPLESDSKSRSYDLLNDDGEEVGYVQGSINDYGELITAIRIYPDYQGKGLGSKAFYKVFEELNQVTEINKIVSSWHSDEEYAECEKGMSTNLRVFLDCMEKGGVKEECAFTTPTGKWATKLGFNKCSVSYTSMEANVEFTR